MRKANFLASRWIIIDTHVKRTEREKKKAPLFGPSLGGKTALIRRLIQNKFIGTFAPTIGLDIFTKDVESAPGESGTLMIWEIPI